MNTKRRKPPKLTETLYVYVSPTNIKYARKYGKAKKGSISSYINSLITYDKTKSNRDSHTR